MLSFIVHLTLIVGDWMKNREQEVALSHQKEERAGGGHSSGSLGTRGKMHLLPPHLTEPLGVAGVLVSFK